MGMSDGEKIISKIEEEIHLGEHWDEDCRMIDLQLLRDVLAMLKKQEVKVGKWIPVTNGRGGMECSICHDYAPSYQNCAEYLSKFCPNCGAKMESR